MGIRPVTQQMHMNMNMPLVSLPSRSVSHIHCKRRVASSCGDSSRGIAPYYHNSDLSDHFSITPPLILKAGHGRNAKLIARWEKG
ncbi:predicted protein [Sclerotinia sclerotiorum 1980 UF-70]|uniref:Uncharacterized protein n=1 Tax=Sclerotinia sclerotiorum (strain ATCC 18683 / 1980 / Ss-1) TaxID=665079 RepID=A7EPI4_SCLS1|nr:predicted protein [Sclerotinia sclerotiorum 1980 UF-70]EDO04750.1 predicted protein [Sclerotinia sclerotiorum 1980 UF-70]